jgi:hypothetical protein
MTQTQAEIRKTWVAFGENGAMGSIHATEAGFAVRIFPRDEYQGVYESLEIAKRSITSHHSGDVSFEEH